VQIDLAILPDDPATLRQMLRELVAAAEQQHTTLQDAVQQRDAEIDKLQLLIKRLLRQQFGRRSEQLSADQLQLALEDLEQTVAENEAAQDAAENKQQRQRHEARPNRNHGALPAHLPRYEVLIDVEHRDCPCCGGAMHAIGELPSEQLDIVPAQYACGSPVVRAMPAEPAKVLSWSHQHRSGRSTAAWPPRRW
jgi:transposase